MCHIFATYNTIGKQNLCKKFSSFWMERKFFNNENFVNYSICDFVRLIFVAAINYDNQHFRIYGILYIFLLQYLD